MNHLTYRGHVGRVEFDPEDEIFVGHLAGISDIVGFHADDVPGLKSAFRDAVDDYIAACGVVGKAPAVPETAQLLIHVPAEVQARAQRAAQLSGRTLDEWAERVLSRAADQDLLLPGAR
jgi:predicted HicB family RNase H-like nuclease